eukprot:TRINITY_DN30896_c0_g1_i1.p2 TRINITY_DN30896_c0_g1~~TRINITY_DN30896_c0_g1_i1.p2  ORF type:complete len:289 (-),score=70.16 TRINITY_DN30896_c0_g1_i1:35-901(-)
MLKRRLRGTPRDQRKPIMPKKASFEHRAVSKIVVGVRTRLVQTTVRKKRKLSDDGKSVEKLEEKLTLYTKLKADVLKQVTAVLVHRLYPQKHPRLPDIPSDQKEEVERLVQTVSEHPFFKAQTARKNKSNSNTEKPRHDEQEEYQLQPIGTTSSLFVTSLKAADDEDDDKEVGGSSVDNDDDDCGSSSDNQMEGYDSQVEEMMKKGRKNRPGQRTRQKLAELKYGQAANHKKKILPKRNKEDTPVPSKSSRQQLSGADAEELHPSWAARKQHAGIKQFQGKALKFEQD